MWGWGLDWISCSVSNPALGEREESWASASQAAVGFCWQSTWREEGKLQEKKKKRIPVISPSILPPVFASRVWWGWGLSMEYFISLYHEQIFSDISWDTNTWPGPLVNKRGFHFVAASASHWSAWTFIFQSQEEKFGVRAWPEPVRLFHWIHGVNFYHMLKPQAKYSAISFSILSVGLHSLNLFYKNLSPFLGADLSSKTSLRGGRIQLIWKNGSCGAAALGHVCISWEGGK